MARYPLARATVVAVASLLLVSTVVAPATATTAALPTGSVVGRVLTSDGQPASGVFVTLYNSIGDTPYFVTARDDGRFTVPEVAPGPYRLEFDAGNTSYNLESPYWRGAASLNASPTITVGAGVATVADVRMPKGATISGTMTITGSVHPNSYVRVSAYGPGGREYATVVQVGQAWTISQLRAGSYPVGFASANGSELLPEFWRDAPTRATSTPVTVTAGGSVTGLAAELTATSTITGVVRGVRDGVTAVIPHPIVWATDASGADVGLEQSWDDGRYRISGLAPGSYRLEFRGSRDEQGWEQKFLAVEVGAGNTVADVTLDWGSTLSGEVVRPAGVETPVGGSLTVWHAKPVGDGWDYVTQVAIADEQYAVDGLAPGEYLLFPRVDALDLYAPPVTVTVPKTSAATADVFLEPGMHFTGTMLDTWSKTPVANYSMLAQRLIDGQWRYVTSPLGAPLQAQSGLAEVFTFPGLQMGTYRLEYVYTGSLLGWPDLMSRVYTASADDVQRIPRGAVYHDLNGDTRADVIARTPGGALALYPGNGSGGWGAPRTSGSGWNGMNLVIRAWDFSGDGRSDLLARDASGRLWLYPGNGTGGWGARSQVGSGWSKFTAVFSPGDFDRDGTADVMARDSAGTLWLYRGNGNGGWKPAVKIGTGWNKFTAIFGVGDFAGSGVADVMARDTAGRLWLYRGDGQGGWYNWNQIGTGWGSFTAIFGPGDVNGDGAVDVLAREPSGVMRLYPGNGHGGWGAMKKVASGWNTLAIIP